MNVSREAMLALERHFVGALSAPARTWLEPVPASQLAFAGSVVRSQAGDCVADFGTVESPSCESRLVRVMNRGANPVLVHIGECPRWLAARWRDGADGIVPIVACAAGATLELTAAHDSENEFQGRIRFLVSDEVTSRIDELAVRMTTRRAYPIAQFDFNGSPIPRPFDLGNGARPYRLAVSNSSSVPLTVRFSDLPEWLTFEAGEQRRNGPLAGAFFERRAPFTIQLWARAVGPQQGVVRLETNDPRPQCRSIVLLLSAHVERPASQPAVPVAKPAIRNASSATTIRKPLAEEVETVPVALPRKRFAMRLYVLCALILVLITVAIIVRGLS
ncbi:MAG TPA: hypothetical protein VN380_17025 [Thermoanaerobaculia bacterium]|jgi:hypothetical protein|nr:hypothetical protein [Thermoanaerobaculia bacterium]